MFAGELPLCEVEGCAFVPPEELRGEEPYRGLVKPDIVFFGESLPYIFGKCVMEVCIRMAGNQIAMCSYKVCFV